MDPNLLHSYCSSILIYSGYLHLALKCSPIMFCIKEKKNPMNTKLNYKLEETMHKVAGLLLVISYLKQLAFSIILPPSYKSVS